MKTILYSIFILLLAPCNSPKNISSATANDYTGLIITFQTTACFGQCPIYTLTINGKTKTAIFKGEANTEKIGTFSKSITDDEISSLVNTFEAAKFNSLNDEYLGEIVDFPVKYITYTKKGITKKIKERSGAPDVLLSLEKTLYAFADSEGWKKTEDANH
jgi:hypothetical protein